jgi:hypothetical protein
VAAQAKERENVHFANHPAHTLPRDDHVATNPIIYPSGSAPHNSANLTPTLQLFKLEV